MYNLVSLDPKSFCFAVLVLALKPGDHIRLAICSSGIPLYYHHMLVVKVVDESQIQVIHKVSKVVEEVLTLKPEDITVLDYDCAYTGQEAIDRARQHIGEDFNLLWSNCEHFVTEMRTGTAQSIQVQDAVEVAVGIGVTLAAVNILYLESQYTFRNYTFT